MDRLVRADRVRTAEGAIGDTILVRNGTVAAVGWHAELDTADLAVQAYPGAVIVPGLRDAHFHPVPYTALLAGVSLKAARDLADVGRRISAAARAAAPGEPVVALRLDDESVAEHRLPSATELDRWVGDRPVLLHRYCGHVAVANTLALQLAGIDSSTPNPPGGVIDRTAAGEATGVLRETAIDLVSGKLPGTARVEPSRLGAAMRGLAGLGITSIGAMVRAGEGAWSSLGDEAAILAEAGDDIPIRVGAYVTADDLDQLASAAATLDQAGGRVVWNGVKRFGDGSLGGHTAAMHEPFADVPGESGVLRLTELDEAMGRAALAAGRQVAIHAIGDRACTAVVDLFERFAAAGVSGDRLRIEHASVLRRHDIARLSSIGAIVSVQPPFLVSETEWLEKRVGPERMASTYAFRTLDAEGITLAGGSDCPVEPPDPWAGIAAARDRAGIVPSEGLEANRALAMYTTGGAAALAEPVPLSVGSPADFVVVDRDPVTSTPDEVRATVVIDTYVGGEAVEVDRSRPVWTD